MDQCEVRRECVSGGDGGSGWHVWTDWPRYVGCERGLERAVVGLEEDRPKPVEARHIPSMIVYRDDTPRHHHYVVRWKDPVMFDDGKMRQSVWFDASHGDDLARNCAWQYFVSCYVRHRGTGRRVTGKTARPAVRSAVTEAPDGLCYHGVGDGHEFDVWPGPADFVVPFQVMHWNHRRDTFDTPEVFCGSFDFVANVGPGRKRYRCRGHAKEEVLFDPPPPPPPAEQP